MCVYVGFLCPGIFSIIEGTEMTVYEVRKICDGKFESMIGMYVFRIDIQICLIQITIMQTFSSVTPFVSDSACLALPNVRDSRFSDLRRVAGSAISDFDLFSCYRGLRGFSYLARLSRYALICLCKAFAVPDLLLLIPLDHLIGFAEVLILNYSGNFASRDFIRNHYYWLHCDALNRCRWRAAVREDFQLPVYFSEMVGFRARFDYYPSRLFEMSSEYQVYYCYFVRGFMRLVADRQARIDGIMASVEDDARLTDVQLSWFAADRALFHNIARFSLSNSPSGWCPDTFAGLGAHLSPLWYRRDAPILRYIEPTFVPSDVDCVAIGVLLRSICLRFPCLSLGAFLDGLLPSFITFLETHGDADDFRSQFGLPFAVEILVLRSGMLSFEDHGGLVRWLGACLPTFGPGVSCFSTPSDFPGVTVPMRNFGSGGHKAHVSRDSDGVVLVSSVASRGEHYVYGNRSIHYRSYPGDERVYFSDIYSGARIVLPLLADFPGRL